MGNNHICKKCGGIAGWDSYFQSWICTRCGNEELKPITNADRIRSMSDEELAKAKILCPYTAVDMDMCEKWITSGDTRDCAACALDWLRQKAPHA